MFAATHKAAKTALSKKPLSSDDTLTLQSQFLPEAYSLSQLYEDVGNGDGAPSKEVSQDELENSLILCSCLNDTARVQRVSSDDEYAKKLSLWISKAILPDGSMISQDEMPDDKDSNSRNHALNTIRLKAVLGLEALLILLTKLSSPAPSHLAPEILLAFITHSSPRDTWTTPLTLQLSQQLLFPYTKQLLSPEFINTYLLQAIIRPLFTKSKPSAVTAAGRKAMPSSLPPKKYDVAEMDRASKPWKYDAPYSVAILEWAVNNAPEKIITQSWNLLIPPLLTLLDDPSTIVRVRGLRMLSAFLPKLTPKLLAQTGLGEVFEDAVLPTLLFLPTITPLSESLELVPIAYESLFGLVDMRFAADEAGNEEKMKFLDRVMRKGVLTGYLHASQHATIVEILISQIAILVHKLGIHCVKHLKDILPIISEVLINPFGPSRPEGLLITLKALQVIIQNAWPRMVEATHRMEIVQMLVICWRNVGDADEVEEDIDYEQVMTEIKNSGKLLAKAVEGREVDLRAEIGPLMQMDPEIGVVFGLESTR